MKEWLIRLGFVAIGVLHALPASGVLGKAQLERAYGLRIESTDLLILLQHRALLFALLSVASVIAAFQINWRWPIALFALSSMASFVLIAQPHRYGSAIATVVRADWIGIAVMLVVMAAMAKR
jgi:hypothetical protein